MTESETFQNRSLEVMHVFFILDNKPISRFAGAGKIFGAAALAQIGQITAIEIPTCKARFTIFSAALILSLA